MNTFKKVITATLEALELAGRARALGALRQMDSGFLRQYGYSPEKLARGMSAWPWRADTNADTSATVEGVILGSSPELPAANAPIAKVDTPPMQVPLTRAA